MGHRIAREPEHPTHHVPRVLVVDDDLSVRHLVTLVLEDAGYEVCSAENGLEALERIEREHPDAMVLDLEMPVLNGRAVLLKLRERHLSTPVLLLSANGAWQACHEYGATDALDKPFDIDVLVERIDRLARQA